MNPKHMQATRERAAVRGSALEEYIPQSQLAAELHVTVRTLQIWNSEGIGPPFTRIGRYPYYARSDVLAWLESRKQPAKKVA
jgi:hypothetical protein